MATMRRLAKYQFGRCLLHVIAAGVGLMHGHPHLMFHMSGILRELQG